jgi:patatin-like phospholipase/acyl hydrolase
MSKTVRILSLDGGGMRGIIEAEFLRRFTNEPLFTGTSIGDYFDIIAGTSIGGIQSVALAKGLTPNTLIDLFRNDGPKMFTTDPNVPGVRATSKDKFDYLFRKKESLYSADYMETVLKRLIGEETKLSDLKTNVVLTTWDEEVARPEFVSNLNLPFLLHSDGLAWQYARATGAAPMFLPAMVIDGRRHIDGGVFMNNPANIALSVAKELYPLADKICLLSLGTGAKHPSLFPDTEDGVWDMTKNAASWITGIDFTGLRSVVNLIEVGIAGTQEAVHNAMEIRASNPLANFYYYRFQPEFTHETDSEMDISTPAYLDDLVAHTSTKYAQDTPQIQTFLGHMAL